MTASIEPRLVRAFGPDDFAALAARAALHPDALRLNRDDVVIDDEENTDHDHS